MPTERKVKKVAEIQEELARCTVAIATSYVGFNANDMTNFRQKLREQKVEYVVVKNTLARIAAANTGKDAFKGLLQGPVGLVFGYADEAVPARVLVDFIRTTKAPIKITGGLIGTRLLTIDQVNELATLPSKDIMISRLLGQLNAPITSFVGVLSANLRNFVGVLEARRRQLESAPPPAAAAAPEPAPAPAPAPAA